MEFLTKVLYQNNAVKLPTNILIALLDKIIYFKKYVKTLAIILSGQAKATHRKHFQCIYIPVCPLQTFFCRGREKFTQRSVEEWKRNTLYTLLNLFNRFFSLPQNFVLSSSKNRTAPATRWTRHAEFIVELYSKFLYIERQSEGSTNSRQNKDRAQHSILYALLKKKSIVDTGLKFDLYYLRKAKQICQRNLLDVCLTKRLGYIFILLKILYINVYIAYNQVFF